jgi:acetylornithine deacetylase/succinyl-diaminopimelate desuccinylase-like protein
VIDRALAYARDHRDRFVRELQEFVRFPSVSAQPAHARDVAACAAWLADHLRQAGLPTVQIVRTAGHPIVYAAWGSEPERPTMLIYGHYDVQPPDPLREWRAPPFDARIEGGYLHGRGACDDKGQMFAHVKAIESCLHAARRLPVNVRCLFEGEEEIGSASLSAFVERSHDALTADAAVVSDTRMLGRGRPAITYALRGVLGLEIDVQGPQSDLHSGNFGGAVHNPLEALSSLVSSLHDASGRIAVRGFYDRVRACSRREREEMARVAPSDAELLGEAKAPRGWGEPGYTAYERTTIRPCLVVNGIVGGYQGPGAKAVLPARATAKINVRLVPDQHPKEIAALIREHVDRATPATVRTTVRETMAAKPVVIPREHPIMRVAALGYRRGFGAEPAWIRSGGTIPIVNTLQEALGLPTALMGFALPDDRIHAPNERFLLSNFHQGIATSIWTLAGFASLRRAAPRS